MNAKSHCPVERDTQKVVQLSKDTARTLRRLRRDLGGCERCEAGPDCPILQQVNAQVQAAIAVVVDEWGWG